MAKRAASQNVSPRTVMTVLGGLVVIIGLVVVLMWQANFLVGRSLLIAFGNGADSKYKGARFAWNGDLVARDFELEPFGPDADAKLTFERVRVDTPGWPWVIKTLRGRKLVADTHRLHVILEGGTSNAGLDPSLGDLGPFGADTASPFEAEGCMDDDAWLRTELVEMGLTPGPTTLEFDYQVQDRQLETRIVLETPGVSKVSLLRHEALSGKVNPYLLDLMPTLATEEHWTVEDQGFVKARNAFCAKRDGITADAFVARHVAAVQRLLAIEGLSVDAESLAAYEGFARNGGEIRFGGRYAMPLHSDIFYDARYSGEAFTRMNGMLERERRKLLVGVSRTQPRPLAGHDTMATYAAMVKEGTAAAPAPSAAALPAATMPAAAVEVPALRAALPAGAPAGAPGSAPPAPTAMAALGDEVPWGELGKYRNREFEITTARMGMRQVRLLEVGKGEITVEGSVQGGRVTNRIHQDGFLRAVLIR